VLEGNNECCGNIMKISKMIEQLEEAKKYMGDVDVLVDTEAGKFPCHMVDIEEIYDNHELVDAGDDPMCIVKLDGNVMSRVHPEIFEYQKTLNTLLKEEKP